MLHNDPDETLRSLVLSALQKQDTVEFEDSEDVADLANAITESIVTGLSEALEDEDEDDTPERAVANLYEACAKWSGEPCEVRNVAVEGPAVELGQGQYLVMEELDPETMYAVLGYQLPDGRPYHHRFSQDSRVFVLPKGVVVIAHPDMVLGTHGIHEQEASAPATDDMLAEFYEEDEDEDEDETDEDEFFKEEEEDYEGAKFRLPVTLTEAWKSPTGLGFPPDTLFTPSDKAGVWKWLLPNGNTGEGYFMGAVPGEAFEQWP